MGAAVLPAAAQHYLQAVVMTWHPDIPEHYRNQIVTGDARELAKAIPDESIDLIICDPVYWNIEDYEWLAQLGNRVLVEGGNLLAQSGHYHLHLIYGKMNPHLDYVWTVAQFLHGKMAWNYQRKIGTSWKPYLWYAKGKRKGRHVMDWIKSGGAVKTEHIWQDNPRMFIDLIDRLTDADEIVLDPFAGSGTVGAACIQLQRDFVSFEIDPVTAELARERVRNTQPPLLVPQPEQMALI